MIPILPSLSDIARHDVLGGLIHEYRAAAGVNADRVAHFLTTLVAVTWCRSS
jgi:hypothetical protein